MISICSDPELLVLEQIDQTLQIYSSEMYLSSPSFNIQRDEINLIGTNRCGIESGQKLVHFYSIDRWHKTDESLSSRKRKTYTMIL